MPASTGKRICYQLKVFEFELHVRLGKTPRRDKNFAAEITIFNAKVNRMQTEQEISGEHITNNASVRNTLIERGIRPERLPQAQKSARPRPGA